MRNRAKEVFVNSDCASLEFFSGLITLGASITGELQADSVILSLIYYVSIASSLVQIITAFPLNILKLRHYTNLVAVAINLLVSYFIYLVNPSDWSGIGGFFMVAVVSAYCAFKTRIEIYTDGTIRNNS